jgi:3-isopropylmalate/(R)-2-methylmalate dehydratase small subunit
MRHARTEPDYARFLFHDLRFDASGNPRNSFIYNQQAYRDAGVVVADINWGCGSSREHAVYALVANGVRVVIAPSFGDIHASNCMQHGVLPVRLERETCDRLRAQLEEHPGSRIAVDLEACSVTGPDGERYAFQIAPFDRMRMLQGLDSIDITLQHQGRIEAFESQHFDDYDWVFATNAAAQDRGE